MGIPWTSSTAISSLKIWSWTRTDTSKLQTLDSRRLCPKRPTLSVVHQTISPPRSLLDKATAKQSIGGVLEFSFMNFCLRSHLFLMMSQWVLIERSSKGNSNSRSTSLLMLVTSLHDFFALVLPNVLLL